MERLYKILLKLFNKGEALDHDIPTTEIEARIIILLRALGISDPDLQHLEYLWQNALQDNPNIPKRDLLRLAGARQRKGMSAENAALHNWKDRVLQAFANRVPGINIRSEHSSNATESSQSSLDLKPLVEDYPNRVFNHSDWKYIHLPFTHLPKLPLEDVWVDVEFWEEDLDHSHDTDRPLSEVLNKRYEQAQYHGEPAENILERISSATLLVGAPGTGKTTMLKWLTRKIISSSDSNFLIPIIIPLRMYSLEKERNPQAEMLQFAARALGFRTEEQRGLMANALGYLGGPESKNVLLMLDGWDEVPERMRATIKDEILHTTYAFPILITSRPSAFPRSLPVNEIYQITDLASENSRLLVQRWFAHRQKPTLGAEFLKVLNDLPDYQMMARNPFLLHLMCGLVDTAQELGKLKQANRSYIYERAIDLIRKHFNNQQHEKNFDQQVLEQTARFALWLFTEAPGAPRYLFNGREFVEISGDALSCRDVLKPSRLINQFYLDDTDESLYFLHTTFQEFLAAKAMQKAAPLSPAILRERVTSSSWREIIRFYAANKNQEQDSLWQAIRDMIAEPDRFGIQLLQIEPFIREASAKQGGKQLIGIDLREALWSKLHSGANTALFLNALIMLDHDFLATRMQRDKSQLPDAVRFEVVRIMSKHSVFAQGEKLLDDLINGEDRDAAVASYAIRNHLDKAIVDRILNRIDQTHTSFERKQFLVRALAGAPMPPVLSRLIEIASGSDALSPTAVTTLADMPAKLVLPKLIKLFEEASTVGLQKQICQAIGKSNTATARKFLLNELALRREDDPLIACLLDGLAEHHLVQGAEILLSWMRDSSDPELRLRAIWAAENAQSGKLSQKLHDLAKGSKVEGERIAALAVLRKRANYQSHAWLYHRVKDQSRSDLERANALETLLMLIPRFIRRSYTLDRINEEALLQDCEDALRLAMETSAAELVFNAVSRSPLLGTAALPQLHRILLNESTPESLREACATSIGKIASKDSLSALADFLEMQASAGKTKSENSKSIDACVAALAAISPEAMFRIDKKLIHSGLSKVAFSKGWLVYENQITDTYGKVLALNPAARLAQPLAMKAISPASPPTSVFISYSHDSAQHKKQVLALADKLRQEGFDLKIDQDFDENIGPSQGWHKWTQKQINECDVVIMICSEVYRKRFTAGPEDGTGKGVRWEGAVITAILYEQYTRNTKFLCLLPETGKFENIPQILKASSPELRLEKDYKRIVKAIRSISATKNADK